MRAVRHQHQWAEATLDAVATPVLVVGASDRVVAFVNRAASKLVGKGSAGATVGHAFGLDAGRHITYADGHLISREDNPVSRAAKGEEVGPVELRWLGAGHAVVLVCYAEHVAAVAAEPAAVVVSLFDITAVRKLQDRLGRAENARDQFVHLAAHELRTPLTSLQLQVESARREHGDLPAIVAVGHAVNRMTRRVEQLLEVVDMSEHLAALHPERVDLLQIVGEAARMLEPQAGWARSSLTIVPAPSIHGSWDKSRLTQVIASIISNALKFGAAHPVEIVPGDEGNEVSVSVVDHGIGVKASDREAIFERCHRRISAAHFNGLGLDLWIARELMHQMGGSIAVSDTPRGGATFTIRLPK